MHIPQRYRDRYDRLALSHPWMREMRDEDARDDRESYEERLYDVKVSDCPYCGCTRVVIHEYNDAYERPNSYRVEHVDERESFNRDCFESYYGFDSIEKAVEHADMREGHMNEHPKQMYVSGEDFEWLQEQLDDEPTNVTDGETNGIADETTLPDGEAVDMLRKYVEECESANGKAGTRGKRLLQIADMVERDYVSRETHSKAYEIWQAASGEWCKRALNAEAERDEALEIRDKALGDAATFKYERDELKRALDMDSRIRASQDSAIEEIAKQRDKWMARAEQAERAMNAAAGKWARADARSAKRAAAVERLKNSEYHTALDDVCAMLGWGHEPHFEGATAALIDLLEDDGATNLEWLFEHDYETLCDQMGGQPCSCCVVGCEEDLGSDEACAKALREWLMAPHEGETVYQSEFTNCGKPYREGGVVLDSGVIHPIRMVDARRDTDGTCLDAMRQSSTHSKTQSKTGPKLTEQSESLSDEADTREKLEEDVRAAYYCLSDHELDPIFAWLDRQDAITRRELQGEVDRLKRERDSLAHDLAESESLRRAAEAEVIAAKAAKDYWRGLRDQKVERDEQSQ